MAEKIINKSESMKHFHFLANHKILCAVILFTGIGSALLEGMGISLIYPMFADSTNQAEIPFPLNCIMEMFVGIDLVDRLQIVAILLILIAVLKGSLLYVNIITTSKLNIITRKYFYRSFFDQVLKVGMGYFNSKKVGEFHTICTGYINSLAALIDNTGKLIPRLFNIIILFVMAILMSWQLTLFSVALVIFASMFLKKIMRKAEIAGKNVTIETQNFNSHLLESLLAMKVIRLFRQENKSLNSFENVNGLYNRAVYVLTKLRGSVPPVFESISMLCVGIILIMGTILISEFKSIGVPLIAMFLVIFQRVTSSTMAINQFRVSVKGDLPAYRAVFQFLDSSDKQILADGNLAFTHLKDKIEFKNVTFGYKPHESIVVENVNLSIPMGAKVGVVGFSGAGKSTLTELLLRFYDPQEGQVLIDGVDLREFDIGSWRRRVGVVSQDVFLFNDTVHANIAFAKPEATQEEIEAAARKAYAHDFIRELPQGYNTLIGDRGVLLSGGQKQRIAIARAIIINPDILIFDEATSALDSEAEKIVQQALGELGKERTVITIAHRLSTIFDCDNIFVLSAGKIAEQGTHQKLIQQNGQYSTLVEMQELEYQSGG
jgi:ABC-type multidrug transport system fused ATPase/permease subunit